MVKYLEGSENFATFTLLEIKTRKDHEEEKCKF